MATWAEGILNADERQRMGDLQVGGMDWLEASELKQEQEKNVRKKTSVAFMVVNPPNSPRTYTWPRLVH